MTERKPILVLGAGGHAKVVLGTLDACRVPVVGILDDRPDLHGRCVRGITVLGPISFLNAATHPAVIAIGDNDTRGRIARTHSTEWFTLVHPHAWVDPSARIGHGSVVFAGAVVQAGTLIGSHVVLNTGAIVDHDCRIGDYAHIAPGARLAGDVKVGEGVLMGIGSIAVPGVRIGPRTVVGAGAVVVRDLPEDVVAIGAPARPIRPR